MNGGYEMIWKLSYGNWVHVYNKNFICFEDFTKLLAFFCVSKTVTEESKGIKISP